MKEKIFDTLTKEVEKSDFCEIEDKEKFLKRVEQVKNQQLNIMFVGATGVGKSSTINAIFDMEIAKVGYSVNPETASISKYELDNITLWDTPGLGDNPSKDQEYAKEIVNALKRKDEHGNLLIDEIVVLIDGSNRDMKTAYEILENIVLPYIGDTNRIVVAINQCDMGLKGRYWDYDLNLPEERLDSFLNEKVMSVRQRIMQSTGVSVMPMYYSALYHYNISKLLLLMIKSMPETKRFLFTDSLNKNPDVWKKNDKLEDYGGEIQKEVKGSVLKALDGAAKGAIAGATVGSFIPGIGTAIGAAIGAGLGFFGGLIQGR